MISDFFFLSILRCDNENIVVRLKSKPPS